MVVCVRRNCVKLLIQVFGKTRFWELILFRMAKKENKIPKMTPFHAPIVTGFWWYLNRSRSPLWFKFWSFSKTKILVICFFLKKTNNQLESKKEDKFQKRHRFMRQFLLGFDEFTHCEIIVTFVPFRKQKYLSYFYIKKQSTRWPCYTFRYSMCDIFQFLFKM